MSPAIIALWWLTGTGEGVLIRRAIRWGNCPNFFYDLGCSVAFNLDGGRSSEMAFMGQLYSQPPESRRSTTEILYIGEE